MIDGTIIIVLTALVGASEPGGSVACCDPIDLT